MARDRPSPYGSNTLFCFRTDAVCDLAIANYRKAFVRTDEAWRGTGPRPTVTHARNVARGPVPRDRGMARDRPGCVKMASAAAFPRPLHGEGQALALR